MYICTYLTLSKALSLGSVVFVVVVVGKGARQTASKVDVGSQFSAVTVYLLCVGTYIENRIMSGRKRKYIRTHIHVC